MWLNSNSEGVCPAAPIHREYMDAVRRYFNQIHKPARYITKLPVCQKTFIYWFLTTGAIIFQEMAHPAQPLVFCDIIGDKIKRSAHRSPLISIKKTYQHNYKKYFHRLTSPNKVIYGFCISGSCCAVLHFIIICAGTFFHFTPPLFNLFF